jgi:2-polyprenyl-3-methyl-5-hydroxy-6-metoxy-1,4-benzoquinol methylase
MAYNERTTNSPSKLKRFSHSRRFLFAVRLLNPEARDRILDYGTGDGHLLTLLRETDARASLVGFEPIPEMGEELSAQLNGAQSIKIVSDLTFCEPHSFGKIACLEVLEHLQEEDIETALVNMKALLAPGGTLIISVPLEIGPSAIVKNVVRFTLGQAEEDMSVSTLTRSLLGMKVSRKLYGNTYGHMGFDYRRLEKIFLGAGFQIKRKTFSPFPILRSTINSQIYYLLGLHT